MNGCVTLRPFCMRPLFCLVTTTLVVVLLLPLPAYAFEQRSFRDRVVGPEPTRGDVSNPFGNVEVVGAVDGDVRSGLGSVVVKEAVSGDVKASFGDIEVYAPVNGDVQANFGDVYVDSTVRGHVNVERGDVKLGPDARIEGNLRYNSGRLSPHQGAHVAGHIASGTMVGVPPAPEGPAGSRLLGLAGWFLAALLFAALNLLAAVVAPGPLTASAQKAGEFPLRSLALGVASIPVALVLATVLALSGIGIPILLLFAPAYLALVLFGALVVAYSIGRKVLLSTGRYTGGNAWAAVIGAFIVAALYLLPLGNILVYALCFVGAGATILALLARSRSGSPYASHEAYVENGR